MFLFKLKLKLLIIMDNFKFNIYLFVLQFWHYLFINNNLEISNIKLINENMESDMEISDLDEE
jgi:hypothetical protein